MFWRLSLFYLVPGTRFCLGSCWTRVIMRYKHPCRVRPGFTFPGSPQPPSMPSMYWVSVKVKVARSCPTLYDPMHCTVHGILQARILELGSLSLLQWIFPTQGLNPGLLHCRQILSQLSHQGSPRILEWIACPFSRGSSWPRNRTGVSSIAGRFLTNRATREALCIE